jgi:hypothetical protein
MAYDPSFAPPPVAAAPASDKKWMAIVSLVLGILDLCAWFIPCCGCTFSIVGIVFGILGLKTSAKKLAIVGIVLSAIGLLASLIYGIYSGVTNAGQYQEILNQYMQ